MPLNGDEVSTDPTSTENIAADVIKDLDAGGDGSGSGDVSTGTDTSTEVKDEKKAETPVVEKKADDKAVDDKKPVAKEEKKVIEEDDDFDKVPAEIDDPNPRNKGKKIENRIPHSRVKVQVAKARAKAKAEADAEWEAKHAPVNTELSELRDSLVALNHLAMTDPDKFLAELATTMPIYKEYSRAIKAVAEAEEKPGPDIPDDKGNMIGYSPAQAEKLVQYLVKQETNPLREEIAPVAKAVQTREEAERAAAQKADRDKAVAERVEAKIKTARDKWEGYADNEKEIQDVYLANPTYTLEDAYRAVIIPKLQAAARDARGKVIDELKTDAVDTSVASGITERTPESKAPKTTEDYAREEIARLERAG